MENYARLTPAPGDSGCAAAGMLSARNGATMIVASRPSRRCA